MLQHAWILNFITCSGFHSPAMANDSSTSAPHNSFTSTGPTTALCDCAEYTKNTHTLHKTCSFIDTEQQHICCCCFVMTSLPYPTPSRNYSVSFNILLPPPPCWVPKCIYKRMKILMQCFIFIPCIQTYAKVQCFIQSWERQW